MKKIPFLFALLLLPAGLAAQNPTACFMEGSTFRTQFNPAFAPVRGYVNLPFAGALDLSMSNTVALEDFFFRRGSAYVTLLDPAVSATEALRSIRDRNTLSADVRMNVVGFGKYTDNGKHFWSVDINVRGAAEFCLPGSMVRFVKQGHDGEVRNLGFSFESYLDAGFGYSFPLLGDKLYVGAKAKFILGLARMKFNYDRIDVALQENRWAVEAEGIFDAHFPGFKVEPHYDSHHRPYYGLDELHVSTRRFEPAGYGFAVDLGAVYEILPDLKASLAVVDLGFIGWTRSASVRGRSSFAEEYTGIVVENGQTVSSPDFSFKDLTRFERIDGASSTRMLCATMNAGVEYALWRHRVVFGLLYQSRFRDYKTLHSLTASVNFSPIRWFTLSGSYTVGSCGGSWGLALNLCPGWINFFLATDILTGRLSSQYVPVSLRSAHVTFGLGFPLGRRGLRLREYAGAAVER